MPSPAEPKIYHIIHVDRLPSIIADGYLWCDANIVQHTMSQNIGTTIGMNNIKCRRLNLPLSSYSDLRVGQCVPFYFCPRSVMLYVIHRANNPDLVYRGGQNPIIHLEADLHKTVAWANQNDHRWAFTLSNAGSYYFEDRADLNQLSELNWEAINARSWRNCKDPKQAEFLVEQSFPWQLIDRIGWSGTPPEIYDQVKRALKTACHKPPIEKKQNWYY